MALHDRAGATRTEDGRRSFEHAEVAPSLTRVTRQVQHCNSPVVTGQGPRQAMLPPPVPHDAVPDEFVAGGNSTTMQLLQRAASLTAHCRALHTGWSRTTDVGVILSEPAVM